MRKILAANLKIKVDNSKTFALPGRLRKYPLIHSDIKTLQETRDQQQIEELTKEKEEKQGLGELLLQQLENERKRLEHEREKEKILKTRHNFRLKITRRQHAQEKRKFRNG